MNGGVAYPPITATNALSNSKLFNGFAFPCRWKFQFRFQLVHDDGERSSSSLFSSSTTRLVHIKRQRLLAPPPLVTQNTTTQLQPETTSTATASPSPSESDVVRRLVLLRHAESSWEDPSIRDHDRPLSNAGQDDAVKVSQKLQMLGWIPQLIISSDARRTKETLKIMQEAVQGFLEAEVHFLSSLYSVAAMDGQTAEHLQRAICEYSQDEIDTVMCMGHNRGWEEAASMFCGDAVELKTCNAALLEAAGRSWKEAFSLAGFGGWKLHGVVKPDAVL